MSLFVFALIETRLLEIEAKATKSPLLLVEGPAVVDVGVPLEQVVPHTPLLASIPFGARSKIMGSPTVVVGFTERVRMFEIPPPGPGFIIWT